MREEVRAKSIRGVCVRNVNLIAGTAAAGKDEKECCEETGVICYPREMMLMRYNMGK